AQARKNGARGRVWYGRRIEMGNRDFAEWWDDATKSIRFLAECVKELLLSRGRSLALQAWLTSQERRRRVLSEIGKTTEASGAGGVTRGQRLMNRKEILK